MTRKKSEPTPIDDVVESVFSFTPEQIDEMEREEVRKAAEIERAKARAQEFIRSFDPAELAGRAAVEAVKRTGAAIPDPELFANPEPTAGIVAVRRFMESDLRTLVLCGGVGTGKTFAAAEAFAGIARHRASTNAIDAMEREPWRAKRIASGAGYVGRLGVWLHVTKLAQRVEPWSFDLEAGVEKLDLAEDLIVVDDVGIERDTDRFVEAFGIFIDARALVGKTIITTNLAKADIRQRYGDRIADRLNHVGACVELKGKSMRRKGAGF